MVRNLQECDEALRQIALIEITVSKAEALKIEEQLRAEQTYTDATKHELKRKEGLESEVEAFYRANRKTLESDGKRSKDLNFGRIGFRKGKISLSPIKGWKWPQVSAAIEEKWTRFLRVKKSVKKDELKSSNLTEEQLAEVGLKRRPGSDEFFIETFPEKVQSPTV